MSHICTFLCYKARDHNTGQNLLRGILQLQTMRLVNFFMFSNASDIFSQKTSLPFLCPLENHSIRFSHNY